MRFLLFFLFITLIGVLTSTGNSKGTNRIQVGYGKQSADIFCVGGVCKNVTAGSDLTLSITSSF